MKKRPLFSPGPVMLMIMMSIGVAGPVAAGAVAHSSPESRQAQAFDPQSLPEIVARVNGEAITRALLIERADAVSSQLGIQSSSLDFYRKVLDDLVGAELLYQASAAKGMSPSDEELQSQIGTLKARYPSEEAFANGLTAQGLTIEKLKWLMSKDMSISKYIDAEVTPKINVLEGEMKTFYDENSEKMMRPEQVRVSHILIRVEPGSSAEDRGEAQKKAAELRGRIEGGEDFAALAREHSEDPGSKANGGDLSWVSRGQTVPAFEEAAFALKPGETSGVVETQFGYHVIKLAEHKPSEAVPFDEAKEQISEFLRSEQLQKEMIAEVEALKAKAKVEILI